jgi:hypothetical protein
VEEQIIPTAADIRLRKTIDIVRRRVAPLGISVEDYFVGVLAGVFPPVLADEIDAEPDAVC